MTKAELSQVVAESTGHEKADVKIIVDATFAGIKDSMVNGKNIFIRGFGSFTNKKRQTRPARNISKGQSVTIPAHYIPYFKPVPEFKKAIKASKKVKEANTK